MGAILALLSCEKEKTAESTQKDVDVVKPYVYSLVVSTPESKASVDASAFAWQEGDQIAIPVVGDGDQPEYVYFTNSKSNLNYFTYESATSVTFKYGEKAYYPATSCPNGGFDQTWFANTEAASKGFLMEATFTAGIGTYEDPLAFEHKSAMVAVSFSQMPEIATKLDVYVGSDENLTYITGMGMSDYNGLVKIPIPQDYLDAEYRFSFILKENDNWIKKVSKTFTPATGSYYYNSTPIPVGHIIRVQDEVDWGTKVLHIWKSDDVSKTHDFTTGAGYPWKLNQIGDDTHDHYAVIPSESDWVEEGTGMGVIFYNGIWGEGEISTRTDCVYLYRDITFTVPSFLGMKTDYRVYFNNSSRQLNALTAYVWGDAGIYVYWESWNDKQVNAYSQGVFGTGWVGMTERKDAGGTSIWFYEFPDDRYQTQLTAVQIGVSGSYSSFSGDDVNFTNSNHVYWKNGSDAGHTRSELRYIGNLNGDYPGNSILSNKVDGQDFYYYQFSSDYYGYGLNVIFRGPNDGAFKSADTHYLVNQDYWYN